MNTNILQTEFVYLVIDNIVKKFTLYKIYSDRNTKIHSGIKNWQPFCSQKSNPSRKKEDEDSKE